MKFIKEVRSEQKFSIFVNDLEPRHGAVFSAKATISSSGM